MRYSHFLLALPLPFLPSQAVLVDTAVIVATVVIAVTVATAVTTNITEQSNPLFSFLVSVEHVAALLPTYV